VIDNILKWVIVYLLKRAGKLKKLSKGKFMNNYSKHQSIINSGFIYQIGVYSTNGNYTRLAVTKYKPSQKKLEKLAAGNNTTIDRLSVQVIQKG
jgi:hypothetical protein